MRKSGLLTAAMLALGASASAQQGGSVELGGFATAAYFDRTLGLDQGEIGGGGLLGVFLSPRFALEGEAAYVPTTTTGLLSSDVTYLPIRGRLTYNQPLGRQAALLLGAGYVRTLYRDDADVDDDGATGLVGLRLLTQHPLQLRLGSYLDYIPSPANAADDNVNWGVTAGLSYIFGHKQSPPDADNDGVIDLEDRCPNTIAARVVDSNGCAAEQRDSDRDGVNDAKDRCPGTPANDAVNSDGCSLPKDADKDGVTDDKDTCANTPTGAAVDGRGCAASQRDSDNDGVKDDADRCANTPANAKVDAAGCPVPTDSDGDGVPDDRDRCPNTAQGVKVDAKGCHELPEKTPITLKGVTFETGQATLTAEAEAVLTGVAQSLAANPEARVEVQGHTDNTGSRAVNMRLSTARATTVRQFLIDHGVAADQLTAKGYGPDKPVASNDTKEGRAENRRVTLERLP